MALDLEAAHAAKHASVINATTKHGHEKARAETVNIPVRLDFGVMFEHVQGVIHDLSHHEVLLDVGRILGQRELQQTILENYGDIFYKQIRNTIRDIAFGDPPATNGVERALNHLRTGATIAGLGWNVATSLLQPLGLANTDRAHRRQVDHQRDRPVAAQSDRDGGDGAVDRGAVGLHALARPHDAARDQRGAAGLRRRDGQVLRVGRGDPVDGDRRHRHQAGHHRQLLLDDPAGAKARRRADLAGHV